MLLEVLQLCNSRCELITNIFELFISQFICGKGRAQSTSNQEEDGCFNLFAAVVAFAEVGKSMNLLRTFTMSYSEW